WIAAAQTPLRPKHDGLLPVPGNGGYEWSGFLRVDELPQSFNPTAGWLATANHKILPPGYKHQIGYEFAPPYRFQRIAKELGAKEKWELSDCRALQHDVGSIPGLALARLLKDLDLRDKALEPFAKWLTEWDGKLTVEAKAGPLYALWLRNLQDALVSPHVPKELKPALISLSGLPVMIEALEKADAHWFGPDARSARDQVLRSTFAQAVAQLQALPAPQRSRWGALHTVSFRHPLATFDAALARAFDVGPYERSGDAQ